MSYTVVIPTKSSEKLARCVAAIRECGEGCRIIAVDDGLDEIPAGINVVAGIKPFVFSRNVNIGIREAGSDDVVVMNDDALLAIRGGLSVLHEATRNYPNIGLIGAVSNSVGNPWQMPRSVGLRYEKRTVCFICVLIPRATINQVGLLDERFVHYGIEDDDYCLRVRNAGLHLAVHDGCFVDHLSLASSYRGPAGAGGDYRPNLELFKQKWGMDNWGRKAL